MTFDEATKAIEDAKQTASNADRMRRHIAVLLANNLRSSGVWGSELKALKRELADYNIHTGKWKGEK